MTSLKSINRRVGSLFAVAALVLATVTPGLVPSFASAAQVTERSVELSSSSKQTSNVTYKVSFTAITDAKAVVLDFCENSPLLRSACTAPGGFSVSAATVSGDFTKATGGTANDANTFVAVGEIDGTTEINVANVTNPTAAGPLYVRIVTYDAADSNAAQTAATAYTSTTLGSGVADEGSAAVSITDSIGVSGAVLETMTFCVAGNAIDDIGCTRVDDDDLEAPTLQLGELNGTVRALSTETVSTGSIYSQLSTNAAGGAVVSLKSGNTCGGLKRLGVATCDIVAANGAGGILENEAKFGLQVKPGGDPATGTSGTLQIAGTGTTPYYSDSVFKLNYVNTNASGITSPFGDPIMDTAEGPVSNKSAEITFGASIAPNTPAGLYSTDLSLIATGKF